MTTIRDIAQASGVSIGTVSNFLNDPQLVAEATRERIANKIKELDYHPKAAARSLKSRLTHRIGLVPVISSEENRKADPGDEAFLELLSGLNTIAAENGFDILIAAATDLSQELTTYARLVGEAQVDGLVITGIRSQDERIKFLHSKKFPFVTFGRSDIEIDYSYVDVNGANGIISAINHLTNLGHQRIAYITPPAGLMCAQQRWEGFVQGMSQNHLQIHDDYIVHGDFSENTGFSATDSLLDLSDPPTAIIAPNDICAFGTMRALQSRLLKPGEDVSIIGFDDIALAQHWQPGLTTIAQNFRKLGFSLMQSLFNILSNRDLLPQKVVEPQLIIRKSTGRCKLS